MSRRGKTRKRKRREARKKRQESDASLHVPARKADRCLGCGVYHSGPCSQDLMYDGDAHDYQE